MPQQEERPRPPSLHQLRGCRDGGPNPRRRSRGPFRRDQDRGIPAMGHAGPDHDARTGGCLGVQSFRCHQGLATCGLSAHRPWRVGTEPQSRQPLCRGGAACLQPVNRPRCPVQHHHNDGAMRLVENAPNPDAYCEPNSFGGPQQDRSDLEPALELNGPATRFDHRDDNDDFSQPQALFMLLGGGQQARLFANIAAAMVGVPVSTIGSLNSPVRFTRIVAQVSVPRWMRWTRNSERNPDSKGNHI